MQSHKHRWAGLGGAARTDMGRLGWAVGKQTQVDRAGLPGHRHEWAGRGCWDLLELGEGR